MSLSCLYQYTNANRPWFVINDQVYLGSKNGWEQFGNSLIGFQDLGSTTAFERNHLAQKNQQSDPQNTRSFEGKILAAYREEILPEESRQGGLMTAHKSKQKYFPSLLKDSLHSFGHADAYIGHDGSIFGLNEGGSFCVKDKKYFVQELGSARTFCNQHERHVLSWRNSHMNFFPKVGVQSYLQVEDNDSACSVVVSIQPFAMKTHKGIYSFDSCSVGFTFAKDFSSAYRTTEPYILSPQDYQHPFRREGNAICFNGDERWEQAGVGLEERISLADAPKKIAFVAAEAVRVFRRGYTQKTVPITQIEEYFSRKLTQEQAWDKGLIVYG